MTTRRPPLTDISNNDMTSTGVATGGSRRKSGRAVKVPEKFAPEPSSQHAIASAKRKRGGEDVENDASDLGEEDEDSDGSDGTAEEEEAPGPRRKPNASRKPAAKKPKVNGTVSHEKESAVKLPSRPKGKKVAIADRNAEGLYGMRIYSRKNQKYANQLKADVFTSGDNPEDVAGQFLAKYEDSKVDAVKELVNFVLKSAGCDLRVTDDDIEDPENIGGKLGELQEEYQAVSLPPITRAFVLTVIQQNIADYPLILKAKSSHDFRANFSNFFRALIDAMHKGGVMYEEDVPLIENIHAWLATMTSCFSRPFRHTATVASLAVTGALCALVTYEVEVAAQVRRQIEGEKKKKGANKARLADYQQKVNLSETKQQFLKGKVDDFFETVYVHRYRDVDPRIRTECIEAMGEWINALPSVFLEGAYLRYLGWMLSDTHPPVRHAVIKQLHNIMEVEANVGTMRHFIERFRSRMIEMATQDSDTDIRASAVQLVNLIREAGLLEPNDIDAIGKLIFDSENRVRKAVVDFFVASMNDLYDNKVEELGGEEDLEELLLVEEEDFDSPRREWIKLKTLAEILSAYDAEDSEEMPSQIQAKNDSEFLNVSGSESRFTHAAQALYTKADELKEWEILAGYLLFDHSSKPKGNKTERALKEALKPTDSEEIILLEILNAIVKLALSTHGDEAEKSKDKGKKASTKAELAEKKEATARRLAGLIPRLLKKYGANPRTVTVVLRLEHVLDLEIFQELRQSAVYTKLLDEISMQFSGHADRGVLAEAGAAFLHAKSYGDLEEVTENKMQSLWEDTINLLRKVNKAGEISIRGSFRETILTELSHNLARLDKLASISNCVEPLETQPRSKGRSNESLPIIILLDIVARGKFEQEDPDLDSLEDEVVLSAIRSSMFYFMWKMHALTESISTGSEITDSDIDSLRELQDTFISNLVTALSSRATLDPVRLFATGTLLDLHVLFSTLRPVKKSKAKNGVAGESNDPNDHLQILVQEIDSEVQQELTGIFDQAEKQFAKKGKKKLAVPGDDEAPEDLESEPEDDDEENVTDIERQAETLKAEQHLCELTGKLVLAILAKVIDASGPLEGKLRSRIRRNKDKLGPNFKKVVEYLDEPKAKKSKSHKSTADQNAALTKKASKSAEMVEEEEEEEEEEDDPFAEPDVEEGDEEDMRRRDLLDEEHPASVAEENEGAEEEDDIMGD